VEEVNPLRNTADKIRPTVKKKMSLDHSFQCAVGRKQLAGQSGFGRENVSIILGNVDLLGYRQSTSVESIGHDTIMIFAMPIRQHA